MEISFETAFCPYNDSLLFQFILSELLQVNQKANHAIQFLEHQHTLKNHSLKLGPSPLNDDIKNLLRMMVKLKYYTRHFQKSETRRELQTLRKASNKMLLLASELGDSLCTNEKPHLLLFSLYKIIDLLPELKKPIKKLLTRFADDENVIYFLLMNQQNIDNFFGKGFIVQQFDKLHGGVKSVIKFLTDCYMRRKFDKLIPTIAEKASVLQ